MNHSCAFVSERFYIFHGNSRKAESSVVFPVGVPVAAAVTVLHGNVREQTSM